MYRVNLSVIVLFFVVSVSAQNSYLGRFLAAATKDSLLTAHNDQLSVSCNTPFSMPFIGDSEIRFRGRAFDFGALRYSLKLELRGIGETRALRRYERSQIYYQNSRQHYALNEQLISRYIYYIDMLERRSMAACYDDLISVYEDRINVMEQLKNSEDFDFIDLIKAEKELTKLISERTEELQEVEIANRFIKNQIDDTLEGIIDSTGLISVAFIKNKIENTRFLVDENNIYLKDLKSQFEIARNRYELERAQGRKLISFLEFSYDHGSLIDEYNRRDAAKNYDLYNALIFEIGIKIPMLSNRNDDVFKRQIDFLNDKRDYLMLQKELAEKIKKDESDIMAYIERYELLNFRETSINEEVSLKKYLQLNDVDPLVLLTIQESLIKNRFEKEKIYFSILRNFIYVMDVTGKLVEKPLRNVLSLQQELIGG